MVNSPQNFRKKRGEAALPPPREPVFATDADWLAAVLGRWGGIGKLEAGRRRAGDPPGFVAGGIVQITRPSRPTIPCRIREGMIVFRLNLVGRLTLNIDGRFVTLGTREMILTGPRAAIRMVPEKDRIILPGTYAWLAFDFGKPQGTHWSWPEWVNLAPGMLRELENAAAASTGRVWAISDEVSSRFERIRKLAKDNPCYRRTRMELVLNEFLAAVHEVVCGCADPKPDIVTRAEEEARIRAFLKTIPQRLAEPFTLKSVSAETRISVTTFIARFKEMTGETPRQYLLRMRMNEALRLLRTTDLPVPEIARKVGFASVSRLYALFQSVLGRSPSECRRK